MAQDLATEQDVRQKLLSGEDIKRKGMKSMKTLKKAAVPSLSFVCVLLATIFTITACDIGSTGTPDPAALPPEFEAALLQAKPVPASSTGTPKVLAKYAEGGSNFYLIDVGHIADMYISTIAAVDYTGVPVDFTKTITNTTTYTTSLTKTVSESITVSDTYGVKVSIGVELKAKIPFAGDFTAKTSLEESWSGTVSQTGSRSTSNTATTATQYAEAQTIKYQFGANDHPLGRYRAALYGVCDVYFIIETSQNDQTLLGWETVVCARPNDYFVRSEYAANGVFTNEPAGAIDFDEDFYKNLSSITPPSPKPLIETDFISIRTAVKRITDSGRFNQPFDAVNFSDVFGYNVTTLKQQGYQTVSFYIRLNVREVSNNGGQYIFLFRSPVQSNNYLVSGLAFEHGSAKDTTWWVHYEQVLKFENISLDRFLNEFIIRYGASGDGNDDWENKDLKIQLVFRE
jgi:hypothetical protein